MTDLQGHGKKLKFTNAYELLKIAKPLDVSDAAITADAMVRKFRKIGTVRRGALHAVQFRSAVCKPVRGSGSQTRISRHRFVRRKMTVVKSRIEQHDVPVYFDA